MSKRRLVFEDRSAVYHVVNRLVRREFWLDETCRTMWVTLMRKYAAFCGVEVLTFCVMSNHVHLLVRVPPSALWRHRAGAATVDDALLLSRYRSFYGRKRPVGGYSADELEKRLAEGGTVAAEARERVLARMGDLSVFMRELKYAFARWFNETRGNEGTIWSAKFRSILVEDVPEIRLKVAAYIDLNPVRAGLEADPAGYRWSGYGEACAGSRMAQAGLQSLYSELTEAGRVSVVAQKSYAMRLAQSIPRQTSAENREPDGAGNEVPDFRPRPGDRVVYLNEARAIGRIEFVEGLRNFEASREGRRPFRPRSLAAILGAGWFSLCRSRIVAS